MDNYLNTGFQNGDDQKVNRLRYSTVQPLSSHDASQTFYQQFVTNLRGFDYSARTGPTLRAVQ